MAAASSRYSIREFPELFMLTSEWNEIHPSVELTDERRRPYCIIINNLQYRGVDHKILRRVFQLCGFDVVCFSNVIVDDVVKWAKHACKVVNPKFPLMFYVISDGSYGVLADWIPYKKHIGTVMDVFTSPYRRLKWFNELYVFDSNQQITKEFDANGDEIPTTEFESLINDKLQQNQLLIFGCKRGEILHYHTIEDTKMTTYMWAFSYHLMSCLRNPNSTVTPKDYLMESSDLDHLDDQYRTTILPECFQNNEQT